MKEHSHSDVVLNKMMKFRIEINDKQEVVIEDSIETSRLSLKNTLIGSTFDNYLLKVRVFYISLLHHKLYLF